MLIPQDMPKDHTPVTIKSPQNRRSETFVVNHKYSVDVLLLHSTPLHPRCSPSHLSISISRGEHELHCHFFSPKGFIVEALVLIHVGQEGWKLRIHFTQSFDYSSHLRLMDLGIGMNHVLLVIKMVITSRTSDILNARMSMQGHKPAQRLYSKSGATHCQRARPKIVFQIRKDTLPASILIRRYLRSPIVHFECSRRQLLIRSP